MEQVEIPGSGVIGSCGSVFPATGIAISVSMYRVINTFVKFFIILQSFLFLQVIWFCGRYLSEQNKHPPLVNVYNPRLPQRKQNEND